MYIFYAKHLYYLPCQNIISDSTFHYDIVTSVCLISDPTCHFDIVPSVYLISDPTCHSDIVPSMCLRM